MAGKLIRQNMYDEEINMYGEVINMALILWCGKVFYVRSRIKSIIKKAIFLSVGLGQHVGLKSVGLGQHVGQKMLA